MNASTAALTAAPLTDERLELLERALDGLGPPALAWVSGYVTGLARERARGLGDASEPARAGQVGAQATILYGSQTGNGRRLAERLKSELDAAGLPARLVSAADYAPRDLASERLLYVVVSTHGEGEPPDDARALNDFLVGKRAPRLEQLAYAVFALGDSSYPQFCETGRVFDERLAGLGARRLLARVDADLDVEPLAGSWIAAVRDTVRDELGGPRLALVRPLRADPARTTDGATRERPVEADVLENQRITGRGAWREVRHLEIALPEGGLGYEPGDSLGVWPRNPDETVGEVAALLGAAVGDVIEIAGRSLTLGEWLAAEREITRLTRPFLEQHAARNPDNGLRDLLEPGQSDALRSLLRTRQLADVLREFPADWDAAALLAALRPLAPRLYSIASSRQAVGDEAHLAVAVLDSQQDGLRRLGAASSHLAGAAADEARLRAFIEPNPRFRLPGDGSRDIVMIGAGTGVAPYRGFLQQRIESGATGRNWLVFGGRHLDSEFLYQAEWLEALRKGALHRLDAAFSRDQPEKRYVQHALLERGAELFGWLESGATLYVCGDAERMAPDVERALVGTIARHGGRDEAAAAAYLRQLGADKRYLRDVY